MPAFYFHLAFELHKQRDDAAFSPLPNLNIFSPDSLPVHSYSSWASYIAPRKASTRPSAFNSDSQLSSRASSAVPNDRHRSVAPVSGLTTPNKNSNQHPQPAEQDWRFEEITIESVNMEAADPSSPPAADQTIPTSSPLAASALAVKGKFIPSKPQSTHLGCGIVHLYRDVEPADDLSTESSGRRRDAQVDETQAFVDNDCTTLCILAVPSYMTPSDLLGWVGESTMEHVSHFRLIRTGRSNKYMVLMKFHEARHAKKWQRDWNGKLFNSLEPENCHVVFVQSIQFQSVGDDERDPTNFPDMSNDPFTPAVKSKTEAPVSRESANKSGNTLMGKPAPPPTPSLLELPTCPVCLERMDETTGLATIFCQHVFHCACLQKWRGSGCPVCRYTQEDLTSKAAERKTHGECAVCQSTDNLWICLICGHLGCGRYDEAHAFAHYDKTGHPFAMDIATQHIWDYAGDEYVHRLIQNKSDGKLVELPAAGSPMDSEYGVSHDKVENMSLEYTHLLTSQLDSQRMYFEEQVERAVDKASKASAAAEQAAERAIRAYSRLEALEASNGTFANDTVPSLERDKERLERRALKAESTARSMQNEWKEKTVINESLMDRIAHLEKQLTESEARVQDLDEQNRDLSFFISGMEKLKGQGEDVQEGTVTVAEAPSQSTSSNNKKKKKKGKKAGSTSTSTSTPAPAPS